MGRVPLSGYTVTKAIWRRGIEVGAGENSGTVLVHLQMAVVLIAEASVTDAMFAGEPQRLGGGERCDTDHFLPNAVDGQRVVSPKMDGSAGGVWGLWEDSLAFRCGPRG